MGNRLFGRVVQATIDNVLVQGGTDPATGKLRGLRIAGSVTKTIKLEPNTAELRIYNLSKTTRGQLSKQNVPISIIAGYINTAALIFSGVSRTVCHERDGTEWVTIARCGDGEGAFQYARASLGFAAGTAVETVVNSIVSKLGVPSGNLPQFLKAGNFRNGIQQFSHGYTAHGPAAQELDQVLQSLGATWSIQDGKIQVLSGTGAVPAGVPVLNATSGLVGSPQHNAPDKSGGVQLPPTTKFKCFLNSQVRAGYAVQLDSEYIKGKFRIESLKHDFDLADTNYYTEGEGLPTS